VLTLRQHVGRPVRETFPAPGGWHIGARGRAT